MRLVIGAPARVNELLFNEVAMKIKKNHIAILLSLFAVGCGGGGDGDDGQGNVGPPLSTDNPAPPTAAPADNPTPAPTPPATVSTLETVLTQSIWYQINFQPPALGSRIDAIYRFRILPDGLHTGTRQTINIRGNNVFPTSPLLTNFTWSVNESGALTLNINNIVGQPVGSETIALEYRSDTDQLITNSSDFGNGVWEGCRSPNRPPFSIALC